MATSVPEFYRNMARRIIEVAYQQRRSGIRGKTAMEPVSLIGRQQWVPIYGERDGWQTMGRKSDPTEEDTPRTNRLRYIYRAGTRESFDVLEQILTQMREPNSKILTSMVSEGERAFSDDFFDYVFADVSEGSEETTPVTSSFPAANIVAANYVATGTAVNSGITYPKIVEAARILSAGFAPKDGRYLAVTSTEWADMMNTEEIKNRLFMPNTSAVETGVIGMIGGFNIVIDERVNQSGDDNLCVAWHRDAVLMGDSGYNVKTWTDEDRGDAEVLRVSAIRSRALRVHDEGVVQVLCDTTA